jgi:hypothetical protein
MMVRDPVGDGVGEQVEKALRELREEAAWSAPMEEGGNGGAL